MLYLNPNTTNTITVTWTQRSTTGDRFILRITSIAKNTSTDYTLLKSDNLSSYTNRYDQFSLAVGSIETGSYKYEVYDTDSTVASALAVVETGLAFIQTATIGFNTYSNSITYNTFLASSVGIFDTTFDSTFA